MGGEGGGCSGGGPITGGDEEGRLVLVRETEVSREGVANDLVISEKKELNVGTESRKKGSMSSENRRCSNRPSSSIKASLGNCV